MNDHIQNDKPVTLHILVTMISAYKHAATSLGLTVKIDSMTQLKTTSPSQENVECVICSLSRDNNN